MFSIWSEPIWADVTWCKSRMDLNRSGMIWVDLNWKVSVLDWRCNNFQKKYWFCMGGLKIFKKSSDFAWEGRTSMSPRCSEMPLWTIYHSSRAKPQPPIFFPLIWWKTRPFILSHYATSSKLHVAVNINNCSCTRKTNDSWRGRLATRSAYVSQFNQSNQPSQFSQLF